MDTSGGTTIRFHYRKFILIQVFHLTLYSATKGISHLLSRPNCASVKQIICQTSRNILQKAKKGGVWNLEMLSISQHLFLLTFNECKCTRELTNIFESCEKKLLLVIECQMMHQVARQILFIVRIGCHEPP